MLFIKSAVGGVDLFLVESVMSYTGGVGWCSKVSDGVDYEREEIEK